MIGTIPGDVALFVFKAGQAQRVLKDLGFFVTSNGVMEKSGKRRKFDCCGKYARPENLGRVMPGSLKLICDEPPCFNQYLVNLVSDDGPGEAD